MVLKKFQGLTPLQVMKSALHRKLFGCQQKNIKLVTGFTMVEILVVTGIFVLVASVTLANFPDLNNRLSLDLLAHDIALEIRKTQTYSLGFRSGITNLQIYGVHFDDNQQFIIFADLNGNKIFDINETAIDTISIQGRSKIDKLFSGDCTLKTCVVVTTLDITFKRPNPDATFNNNNTIVSGGVVVISPKGEKRKILIKQTGQISVESIQ